MKDYRFEVFQNLKTHLLTDPRVRKVQLTGSLARGIFDEYSDIDLTVEVSGQHETSYFMDLPTILNQYTEVLIADPALSLLPQLYVYNFHFEELPLFCQIDIQVCSSTHNAKKDVLVVSNPISRGLKLLQLYVKYDQRGIDVDFKTLREYIDVKIEGDTNESIALNLLSQFEKGADSKQLRFIKKFLSVLSVTIPH
jgi:predicted nucleotidyltransferase